LSALDASIYTEIVDNPQVNQNKEKAKRINANPDLNAGDIM
jgi:hypothetical protein